MALDDRRFLDQAYLSHNERVQMFFETLKRTREGVCICVFNANDRIQHMFWRYMDPKHPSPCENREEFGDTIPEMYRRMDTLIGKTMQEIGENDILMVLSDHGFSSFRRCIALNAWLYKEGYLAIKGDAPAGADYTRKVYRGLYTEEAPDLIVGYHPGYRVSWDSITGTIEPEIFFRQP